MVRIAVFDDNKLARHTLVGMLRIQGHEVTDHDPIALLEALRALRDERPDLVMVDLLMPNCPGMSLVRAIHEDPVLNGMRVVVVSTPKEQDLVEALVHLGILGFVTKPLDPSEVERHVSEALGCDVIEEGRMTRVAVIHGRPEAQVRVYQALSPAGYQVLGLMPSSLMEVLGFLVADPPELLLVELSLPAFPAASLLRAVKEDRRLAAMPVLLLVGEEDDPPEELLGALEIHARLPWPAEAQELQAEVRAALEAGVKRAVR